MMPIGYSEVFIRDKLCIHGAGQFLLETEGLPPRGTPFALLCGPELSDPRIVLEALQQITVRKNAV